MAVGKKLRWEIFRRDNFACRYCGRAAKDGAVLEVDHVKPRSRRGGDIPTNLVTACDACNSGKSDTPISAPPIEDVPQEAFRRRCADLGVAGVELDHEEPLSVTEEILSYFPVSEHEVLFEQAREWLEGAGIEAASPARVWDQVAANAYFEAWMRINSLTSALQRFLELQHLKEVQAIRPSAEAHVRREQELKDPPDCMVTLEIAERVLDQEDDRLLDGLPPDELAEWLAFAEALRGDNPLGLPNTEAAGRREAARIFRVIAADNYYFDMCSFPGEKIPHCPKRAEHRIFIEGCEHCDGPLTVDGGHPSCRWHTEAFRAGQMTRRSDGFSPSLRDVRPFSDEQREPA